MHSEDLLMSFPNSVLEILAQLQEEPFAESIWFIGSRANQCAREDSDWDFLVFCNVEPEVVPERRSDIDIIKVGPSGRGLLEGGNIISLEDWQWTEIGNGEAYYIGKKFIIYESPFDSNKPRFQRKKLLAYLIWSKGHEV